MPGKCNNHHLCFFSLPHPYQLSSGYVSSVNTFRILISSFVFISLVPTLTFISFTLHITLDLLGTTFSRSLVSFHWSWHQTFLYFQIHLLGASKIYLNFFIYLAALSLHCNTVKLILLWVILWSIRFSGSLVFLICNPTAISGQRLSNFQLSVILNTQYSCYFEMWSCF